jgi:hypothetical protein
MPVHGVVGPVRLSLAVLVITAAAALAVYYNNTTTTKNRTAQNSENA